jgi:serine/threonine protein kinase
MVLELLDGRSYNKSVDVYAFGVLLWELLIMEIPFGRSDVNDLRQRVLSGKRPPMPSYGMSSRSVKLVNKCWYVAHH